MKAKTKAEEALKRLRRLFGRQAAFSGTQTTPFRVLVGTVLSARTKDSTTAEASARLFKKYGTAEKMSKAPEKAIRKLIRPVGFYRTKAKRVKALSAKLLLDYGGKVPETMDALLELPGVGRKTASCVLNYAFNKPAIAVDTHVHRISNRLSLVRTKTPEQTEAALKALYPKGSWLHVNNAFVLFGQNLCLPRKPKCGICVLNELCPARETKATSTLQERFRQSKVVIGNSREKAAGSDKAMGFEKPNRQNREITGKNVREWPKSERKKKRRFTGRGERAEASLKTQQPAKTKTLNNQCDKTKPWTSSRNTS